MLPVLILANSPRQNDHWQRAAEASALKLRLEPLTGALACLPIPESTHANPWLLNWCTLATDESCHLQDLLKSLPPAAFPPSLWLEEGEDEEPKARSSSSAFAATVSSGTPTRLSRLLVGNVAERAAHIAQDELEEREVIALLGLRLTPCQWNILRLLLAHPLILDEELAAFLDLQRRSVRCSLYEQHQLDCLEPMATEAGKRWHLCAPGMHLITAANHMHIRNVATLSDDGVESETSTVVQRGEAWMLQRIKHTAGIYGFFAGLAQDAKREPDQMLCWWETGMVWERRYRVGEQWYNLRPDALAEYRVGQQRTRFWLEWDRGTMNVRDLVVKFTSYAHYIATREWVREHSMLPVLICVVPDIAQEKRMQRVAQDRFTRSPGVVLWTTTEVFVEGPWSSQSNLVEVHPATRPGNTVSSSLRNFLFKAQS